MNCLGRVGLIRSRLYQSVPLVIREGLPRAKRAVVANLWQKNIESKQSRCQRSHSGSSPLKLSSVSPGLEVY